MGGAIYLPILTIFDLINHARTFTLAVQLVIHSQNLLFPACALAAFKRAGAREIHQAELFLPASRDH